ncbi:hypothetical protein ACLQ28_21095 [Micromonospora sp. DT201]|uniref:hypothetical protein n=1 Tax=Micromonospora sp. DT201 TaxID=3393442 RepID=UPI003CF339FD
MTWIITSYALAIAASTQVWGKHSDLQLTWRWIFYVNVPFGLLCLLGTVVGVNVPMRPKATQVRIDYLGAVLLTAAVVCLTLVTGGAGTTYSWRSGLILGLCTVVVVATAALVYVERRAPEPLVPFRMLLLGPDTNPVLASLVASSLVR